MLLELKEVVLISARDRRTASTGDFADSMLVKPRKLTLDEHQQLSVFQGRIGRSG